MISRNAPLGIQVTKEAGRKFIEAGEQAAIGVVPKIRERVMNSDDAKEGIKSFVERRAAALSDDELRPRRGKGAAPQARRRTAIVAHIARSHRELLLAHRVISLRCRTWSLWRQVNIE